MRVRRPRVMMDIEQVDPLALRRGDSIVLFPDDPPRTIDHVEHGRDSHGRYVALRTNRDDRLVLREGDTLARVI